jgi:hypothetical protein
MFNARNTGLVTAASKVSDVRVGGTEVLCANETQFLKHRSEFGWILKADPRLRTGRCGDRKDLLVFDGQFWLAGL